MEERGQATLEILNGECELLCSLLAPLAACCLLPTPCCLLPTALEGSSWRELRLVPPKRDNMSLRQAMKKL